METNYCVICFIVFDLCCKPNAKMLNIVGLFSHGFCPESQTKCSQPIVHHRRTGAAVRLKNPFANLACPQRCVSLRSAEYLVLLCGASRHV